MRELRGDMNSNASRLFYAKYMLKNQLRNKNANPEHLSVIAECIREREISNLENEYYTKEELYVFGFDAITIHKYFNYSGKNGYSNWYLKKNIWFEDKKISSTKELLEAIEQNAYLHAS